MGNLSIQSTISVSPTLSFLFSSGRNGNLVPVTMQRQSSRSWRSHHKLEGCDPWTSSQSRAPSHPQLPQDGVCEWNNLAHLSLYSNQYSSTSSPHKLPLSADVQKVCEYSTPVSTRSLLTRSKHSLPMAPRFLSILMAAPMPLSRRISFQFHIQFLVYRKFPWEVDMKEAVARAMQPQSLLSSIQVPSQPQPSEFLSKGLTVKA